MEVCVDLFAYIPIKEHMDICIVSKEFNNIVTDINTPQINRAFVTIAGWWIPRFSYNFVDSNEIDEWLPVFEERVYGQCISDKSYYWCITRLFYANLSNKVSWNQVIMLMEREYNLEELGWTNILSTRIDTLSEHINAEMFEYSTAENYFDDITEYYHYLNRRNMFDGQASSTLPDWTDHVQDN